MVFNRVLLKFIAINKKIFDNHLIFLILEKGKYKMKKYVITLATATLSILKCFALDVIVENPYKDIELRVKASHSNTKQVETCKKNKKGKKQCSFESVSSSGETVYKLAGNRNIDLDEANAIDVFVYLKGNKQFLPQQSYDAITGIRPLGDRFELPFILDGKEGNILYKTEVKFDNSNKVIKYLKIKVLEATLEGDEFDKN